MTLLLNVSLPLLVILVMTIVGMDLRLEDFLRVRRYPVLVPVMIAGQWLAATLVFAAVLFAVHLTVMIPLALLLGCADNRRLAA